VDKYEIIPIKVGEFLTMEKSSLTYLIDPGKKLVEPIIMYLVKGKDKLILVDTGAADEEWSKKYHHPIRQTEDQKPINALKNLGIAPEDIEIVVNTHLHWDHCFNNALFPKARIYVQKKELEYAINPLPPHYVYYESFHIGMYPQWLKSLNKFNVVDGDTNILPGIDLIFIPGHTPGMQGVLVNTEDGKYLIASDCLGLFENWEGNEMYRHIPSGIHYSLPEYFDTFKKIEKLCDHILPGHDEKVFSQRIYPGKGGKVNE
jgi:glyoxylase-like metal-dependent hydrolase (beta-lactamase superfamily II)